jgi:hypothetical protein
MQNHFQRYRLDRYGLLYEPVKQLSPIHRLPPIKAKRELI